MNFKTITSHLPSLSYGPRIRPVRDWLTILGAAAVLLIASIGWNAWMFYNVTTSVAAPSTDTTTASPSLSALPQAQAVLDARAAEEVKYRTFYEFVDPAR